MNQLASEKYGRMADTATTLIDEMKQLHVKCTPTSISCTHCLVEQFLPYLEQINQIETGVADLEHVVKMLDEYTKRLGMASGIGSINDNDRAEIQTNTIPTLGT